MSRGYRDEDEPRKNSSRGVNVGEASVLRLSDSGLALLIKLHDHQDKKTKKPRELWVPIGQIHDDSEVYDNGSHNLGTLIITEWLANREGLT